jgi:hypothetical protein
MAANRNAVLAKLIRRGGSKALRRARKAVSATPDGALGKRLGLTDGAAGIDPSRKLAINRDGRQVKAIVAGDVAGDAIPRGNVGERFVRGRLPGNPIP